MGSSSDMSSSPYRCRYVSWCVDAAETTAPATAAPTGAGNGGREEKTAFTPPRPQLTLSQRKCRKALRRSHLQRSYPQSSSALHNAEKASKNPSDEGEDDASALKSHKERSSPVISKHHGFISWLGGGTDPPNPPSSDSPPLSSGSSPPDQHGCLTATITDQESEPTSCCTSFTVPVDEKQSCASLTSSLNGLQSARSLPSRCEQGKAECRGQREDCSNSPPKSGLSAPHKQRGCNGIPDFPADIFKTSCELEKENAHFVVVDMVLEVLESVKWTLSFDQQASTMEKQQHPQCTMRTQRSLSSLQGSPSCRARRPEPDRRPADLKAMNHKHGHSDEDRRMTHTDKHVSYGNQQNQSKEDEESGTEEARHQMKSLSLLSNDSGFEDCVLDATLTPTESQRNAEWLAQQLVSEFRRRWLPPGGLRRGRQSLRSSLQELPGTGGVVSTGNLTEEIRLRTRMRGSLNWAPPRFQIIFTAQESHRRSEVVASQHFLCAGCGTEVEPRYIKKLRYCDYLGRYFCDCCHSGSEAVIPGRVLSCWDFSRYSVSDFSKQLLDSVWHQPLFDLTSVGRKLCSKVKELDKFRDLQEQLMGIRKLLKTCRLSERVLVELEQLPPHLMEQPLVFSMDDLLRIKKGQLVAQVRAVLHSAINHVEKCELCMARGFICEFCHERHIIFPFQKDICKQCVACRACFHKSCFAEKKCPKCARIQSRKKSHLHP